MRFLKSIVNISYWLCSAVMIVVGIGIIILAFMNSPLQLQIALGLIGLGLIASGLVQVKRGQDRRINEERFDIIGLPPKKETSSSVRLELKIKGVNHG